MFVAPTITCHPSVYPLYSVLYPCLWHYYYLSSFCLSTIHSLVIHVCGTYYYMSSFCLSTILSVVIHVCGTYYYLSSFCLSTILSVVGATNMDYNTEYNG